MALFDLIVDERLIVVGWMVIEEDNDANSSGSTECKEAAPLSSFSSEDSGQRGNEKVDVVGHEDAIRENEEERCEGKIDPKGAHPAPFSFACFFAFYFYLFIYFLLRGIY